MEAEIFIRSLSQIASPKVLIVNRQKLIFKLFKIVITHLSLKIDNLIVKNISKKNTIKSFVNPL